MEQNINKLGAFVATLALIASVLVMPNVSAGDGDLSVTLVGDNGLTSYGAEYGNASFIGSVSSTSADADDDLTISVDFPDSAWESTQASIGLWDGTDCAVNAGDDFSAGSHNFGTLSGTLDFCISVKVEGDIENGDAVNMDVNAGSSSSTALEIHAQIVVSDWSVTTTDTGVKTFEETDTIDDACSTAVDCNEYTITIHNNKVDEEGNPLAFSDTVKISLNTATEGWDVDSDDSGWDDMANAGKGEYTLGYIDAGATYDFVMEVRLQGENALASSHVGNSELMFQISDDNGVMRFMGFEMIVEDNFRVNVGGSGNHAVDNGCHEGPGYKVIWNATVFNMGNTGDTFDVTFDTTDAVAAAWSITGADNGNTGNLGPKAEEGMKVYFIEMTVPSGLAAGTQHGFTMTVTSTGDSTQTSTQEFSATVEQCYGLSMSVDKTTDSANPGSSADFTISVTNNGNGNDTVQYEAMGGASEWTEAGLNDVTSSVIASGSTAQVVYTLSVPSGASSQATSGIAMVHAFSEACYDEDGNKVDDCAYEAVNTATETNGVSVTLTANQVFDVSAGYYFNASMGSANVQQGLSMQLKFNVTNNGNGNDNIAIMLMGAPSWVVLSQDTVLVAPGQTSTVTMDISAPAEGTLGAVDAFTIKATSVDGTTTSSTGDFTLTIVEVGDGGGGATPDKVDDDDGGLPGFGFLPAIAAIGAVLLLRRRL